MLMILPLSSTFLTLKILDFKQWEAGPPGNIGGDADGTSGRVMIAVAIVSKLNRFRDNAFISL